MIRFLQTTFECRAWAFGRVPAFRSSGAIRSERAVGKVEQGGDTEPQHFDVCSGLNRFIRRGGTSVTMQVWREHGDADILAKKGGTEFGFLQTDLRQKGIRETGLVSQHSTFGRVAR